MGSVDMAFNKILSVLLVAGSAWTNPQNNFFNFNNFATQRPIAPSPTVSTTPVPILRYVDTQNIDGSYTYGYEAADGTYKLETRYTDGRVKGKYGYVDPDGNLREASYGAEAGRGFEPQIEGLELPLPVVAEAEAVNEIAQQPQPQFQNFRPQKVNSRAGQIKIINGRRARVKKVRKLKATPAPARFIDESAQREASLRARQEGLRTLENQRRKLIQLQRGQASPSRQQESRSFNSVPQRSQESFRSQSRPASSPSVQDPYISGIDLSSGSYSYAY